MKQEITLSHAVKRIAWGYLFLHFHINLGTLDILPDWLGYWFMLNALTTLGQECPSALLLRPLGWLLTVWNGWEWIHTLLRLELDLPFLSPIVFAANLYFHFQLLTDLAEIAKHREFPKHLTLLHLRTAQTILITLLSIPWPLPQGETVTTVLTVGLALVGLIVGICIYFTIRDLSKWLLKSECVS